MKTRNKFIQWQKKQHSQREKISFLIIMAIFFIFVLPTGLFFISQRLDRILNFPMVLQPPFNLVGILLLIVGWPLALWAVWVQYKVGRGTPAPMMPTQKLVIVPPYNYCRNPMILGSGIWFLGFVILFNSLSFIFINIFLFIVILFYFKFVEEKELEARFGQEYVRYKKQVPFLIPIFKKKIDRTK
jgi:protein-S-isoprenylcysteine O-methyltransferase Ste14